MKYLFIKLQNIFYSIIKYELMRLKYKYIFYNTRLPYFLRQQAFFCLNELPLNSSLMKLRNRCFLTNNSRATFKYFNMSRFPLKLKVYLGKITGVKKSSW
jgi:small subunit ribosomal protein S14